MNYGFHFNAFPQTFHSAKEISKKMTPAEKMLWHELRNRNLSGCKFRRQHPVGKYIVDFFCSQSRLVIEIDGGIHDDEEIRELDINRGAELERLGLTVIRFRNEAVINDIETVLSEIESVLDEIQTSPPLQFGEGAGG